jgi:hypothetical protein
MAALLRANAFLQRHQAALPAIAPLVEVPRHGALAALVDCFMPPRWERVP